MQEKAHKGLDWVLVFMGGFCLIAGILAYMVASKPVSAVDYVPVGEVLGAVNPTTANFREELLNLKLTDIMAPLPMEGVEPAGVSGNNN